MNVARVRSCLLSATVIIVLLITTSSSISPKITAAGTHATQSNSQAISCPQPPLDFNPLQASASQLAYYRFPPRPQKHALLVAWTSIVRRVKHIACPDGFVRIPRQNRPPLANVNEEAWSGYAAEDNFDQIIGTWNTQCIDWNHNQAHSSVATWIGIGGYSNALGHLFQIGTLLNKYGKYNPWYEAVPQPFGSSPNLSVN